MAKPRTLKQKIVVLYPDMVEYGIKRYGRDYGEDFAHDAITALLSVRLFNVHIDNLRKLWIIAIHRAAFDARNKEKLARIDSHAIDEEGVDLEKLDIPEEETSKAFAKRLFFETRGCLSPLESKIIWYRHFVGSEWKAIKKHLRMPYGNVRFMYSEGMRKIKNLYGEFELFRYTTKG